MNISCKQGDHRLPITDTSPEILSFAIPVVGEARIGDLSAAESGRTHLLCRLLIQYANKHFSLEESGQKCLLYASPHGPSRQKLLNSLVPDSYNRHLFISPCLSGWNQGEDKFRYMELCHRTLSRSQLNTIGKLKDAGIITRNLMVLPNTSTTCLVNNGMHVSLGGRCLTAMAGDASSFNAAVEKYVGDLVIKIVEHFLPLLVTTYKPAPCRLDFAVFHPESVLGFLPLELDCTHLRMIWRSWRKKAGLRVLGRAIPSRRSFLPSKNSSAQAPHGNDVFRGGDFAVFHLAPDKYHCNHMPVSGRVADIYGINGHYHSCNPSALIAMASPYQESPPGDDHRRRCPGWQRVRSQWPGLLDHRPSPTTVPNHLLTGGTPCPTFCSSPP